MDKYVVSHELMQEVLNYLSRRPYNEVYKIVDKMRNLELVSETPAPVEQPSEPSTPGNA